MAVKHNYQPADIASFATQKLSIPIYSKDQSLVLWSTVLVAGRASYAGTILSNAALVIWTGAIGTIGNAKYMTFTDGNGNYGISLPATASYSIKIYS